MSVLPSSATLYSFFIVLLLLVLITFAAGYSIAPIVNTIKLPLNHSALKITSFFFGVVVLPFTFIQELQQGLAWGGNGWCSFFNPLWLLPYILLRIPTNMLNCVLVPELKFPRDQWIMSKYIGNRYVNIQWHPLAAVRDIFRLVLLPVWLALAVAIVVYMSVVGLVILVCFVGSYSAIKKCVHW
jgi:hypothetical protein